MTYYQLQFNDKAISWKFVKELYDISLKSDGLTCIHKLKYEHVNLTPFSKMRVDLAAEVITIMQYTIIYIQVHLYCRF